MDIDKWLKDALSDGPMDTRVISKFAKAERITRAELKAARKRLGAITEHYEDENGGAAYNWRLPKEV